ncbi:hypothetical protein ABZU75_12345 [Streptosporangium sp. NPDC005286]|uniref:hypothetical protein n=1 Tax=Streptosporangium sp. NPDC005286 TaxID=3154463 RepID=UPI0033B91CF6
MTDPSLLAGRYRLLERRDRAGTSWRSRDELLRRDVTISEVPLPPPGPSRDRLLDQIRAAAGLRHPGVTALHDVISGPDRLWLIMESVEGRSLLQSVRADGPLPAERAAEIGLRVLDALAAARELGVHLAAAPDSVLLAPDGRVVLTGVAALGSADELRDLGATLFTAVEGRAPHTGSRPAPLTADGAPLAEPGSGSTASGPLAPLVEELLAAGPGHRPDATSVRLTLERVAPRPAHGGHGDPGVRSGPRRTPVLAAAAAALAVLLLGAAYWFWPRATESTAGSTAGSTPVALPTAFARTPDPCALISTKQADDLALDTTPTKKGKECEWKTNDSGQPPNLRYTLWISAFGFTSDEAARRNYARFLKETRERTRTDVGAPLTHVKPVEALAGIGSEAYRNEVTNQLTYNSSVGFRAANLVIIVQYQRGVPEDANGTTGEGALKTTRWILERLSRES